MAVVFGIGEIVLAAVLFARGMEGLAGVALTLGLWILGRSLKRTE